MIEIKALTKNFDSHIVLTDVNLNIAEGSVFGLIGPNGSGKSTLLRILTGILKPDIGGVLYEGRNVYEQPQIKQNILMISDDPHYFFHASIQDMKEFYKIWYPQFNDRVYHQYLDIFKLDEHQPMKDFSKGMKRQSFIAIALAIAPKYLFLDEAFDGLDPIMRLTFKRAITKMIEEKEMTVIISSHNLREMEDICDSFGILENGTISTSGDLDTAKDAIHKIQLAFSTELQKEDFAQLDVMSIHIQSKVVNLVVKGNIDKVTRYLKTMEPLMMEVLPVNLEELFIYEMERKGYGIYEQ